MNTIYIIVLIYLSYLFLWFVINILAYLISLAFKKPSILEAVNGISLFVVSLLNWAIGLALFGYAFALLFQGEFLWFLFMIFIGIGLLSWALNIIQVPFFFISAYFMTKIEEFDFKERVTDHTIQDKDNVDVIDIKNRLSVKTAKYFLIFYILNLSALLVEQYVGGEKYNLISLIELPLIQIVSASFIVGVPYSIYHRFRYKRFFPKDKRYFFISVWKWGLIIFGSIIALIYMLDFFIVK